MTSPTASIAAALAAVDATWPDAADVTQLSDATLLAVNDRFADLRRHTDAAHARVAAEIASRSRAELGKQGLARQAGFRTPAKLIASSTGGHTGDATRLIAVGAATAPRLSLDGDALPAKHPHVAEAVAAGSLSVVAAAAITGMLDALPPRVDAAQRAHAERALAEQAPLLSLDELQTVLRRAQAVLDPEGLEQAVEQLRGDRFLKITQKRSGMIGVDGQFDPETAAPIVAVIQSIVTHQLRVSRGSNAPGAPAALDDHGGSGAATDVGHDDVRDAEGAAPLGPETRSIPQMNADALATIARHIIGCDQNAVPGSSTTVVVRMSLDQLLANATDEQTLGTEAADALSAGGETADAMSSRAEIRDAASPATIDGIEQPIDAGTARRMAARAGLIPLVLGTRSEPLDLGRAARAFTGAQRIVLGERDGGCAGCHLPPAFTEAHHLTLWSRGGTTDLDEGALLCTGCHHRAHDEGWEIRIETEPGAPPHTGTVWFIPPAHIDPSRTPRLGGRRRFDPLTWGLTA